MAANTTGLPWLQPKDNSISIWRYMDLSKFICILSGKLYFTRPDKFRDPWEGKLPENHSFPLPVKICNSKDEYPIETSLEFVNRWHYVNCWHANEFESAAMWDLYAKSDESIAIKTSFKNLVECLPSSVQIGAVKYLDHFGNWAPPFGVATYTLFCKRKSFDHEREVRLVVAEKSIPFLDDGNPDLKKINSTNGVNLNLDMHKLIDEVYVSPESSSWFYEVVTDVIEKYGYKDSFRLSKSNLYNLS